MKKLPVLLVLGVVLAACGQATASVPDADATFQDHAQSDVETQMAEIALTEPASISPTSIPTLVSWAATLQPTPTWAQPPTPTSAPPPTASPLDNPNAFEFTVVPRAPYTYVWESGLPSHGYAYASVLYQIDFSRNALQPYMDIRDFYFAQLPNYGWVYDEECLERQGVTRQVPENSHWCWYFTPDPRWNYPTGIIDLKFDMSRWEDRFSIRINVSDVFGNDWWKDHNLIRYLQ